MDLPPLSQNQFVWGRSSLDGLNLDANAGPEGWFGHVEGHSFDRGHSVELGSSPEDTSSAWGSDDQSFLDVAGNGPRSTDSLAANVTTSSHHGPGYSDQSGSSSFLGLNHHRQQDIQHTWTQTSGITTSKYLVRHVQEVSHDGVRSYFCGWPDCKHPVGFVQKPQLITHIRSVHLQEKPFLCTTCNTTFARKQDANRHVITMNRGKQYKCSVCQRAFSRKHYRDAHEERCLLEGPSHENINQVTTVWNQSLQGSHVQEVV